MHGVHFILAFKVLFLFLVPVSWGFIFWFKTLLVYISALGFERRGVRDHWENEREARNGLVDHNSAIQKAFPDVNGFHIVKRVPI
jgi:hypothetical protein